MAFHEVRFPTAIGFGASFGPERRTDVVVLASGYEERNSVWANSRRKGDVGLGVRTATQVHELVEFWESRRGSLYGFRFKDKLDFKSCAPSATASAVDQTLGSGDSTNGTNGTATWQIKKLYSDAAGSWSRTITKPVASTVRVSVAGVEQTITTHFTVDTSTGIITFTPGNVPTTGQAITAGFEFDVPVRFDTDSLVLSLAHFDRGGIDREVWAGEVPSIPIVEIRI